MIEKLIDFFFDWHASFGDWDTYISNRIVEWILGAASIVVLLMLFRSIEAGNWIGIVIGTVGTLYLFIVDVNYTVWWFREGRYLADKPSLRDIFGLKL